MAHRVTLDNGSGIFSRYLHAGTLSPSEAATLTIRLAEVLSETPCDEPFLKLISRFLTRQSYEELVTERNINVLCGYPTCAKTPGRIRDVYAEESKISQSMMPYAYLQSYCTKRHYQCSEFYLTQLSDEAVFAREDIGSAGYGRMMKYEGGIKLLEEILDDESGQNASLGELITQIDGLDISKKGDNKDLTMHNMSDLLEDIKIIENEVTEPPIEPFNTETDGMNDMEKYEYLQDQSKAIDGYILR